MSEYEGKQRPGRYSGRSSGDIQDYNDVKGKKNFSGPKASKSGAGVSPKASGSPWSGGRQDQSEGKSYSEDYSRRGSQYGQGANGPRKPSNDIADSIFGKGSVDRGKQKEDHK